MHIKQVLVPMPEIKVHRTPTKIFDIVSKETNPILITRSLNNERLNTRKKLLSIRPNTVIGIRKKRMTIAKGFLLDGNAIKKIFGTFI